MSSIEGANFGRVVVYTRTAGYRHESIPAGVQAVRALASGLGLTALATEQPHALAKALRQGCAVVVFLSTTGEVLDTAARRALERHMTDGGGFVGVHSAAGTEYLWDGYRRLVGARFTRHPELQPALITVEDHDHPATAHLPAAWSFTDEWYDFDASPRGDVRVLASVDESGYQGGGMGADHPLAWCHDVGNGRAFYTALGHTPDAYTDPLFRAHLRGALRWAVRA